MKNFRDLGGYKTSDGRSVKKGIFYRSAHLTNLSQEDIDTLKKLNIKHIFDYRNDDEAEKNPSTEIENIKNIRIPALKMPSTESDEFDSVEAMIDEFFEKGMAYNRMKESYYQLPVNNESYKNLINLVKDPNMLPILSHCTAGKDRTGVGCSIILMLLGVPREDIIKEYLKSEDYVKEFIGEFLSFRPDLSHIPEEKLRYMFGVYEDYIKECFKRIDEMYKSPEEYICSEFNITEKELEEIRNTYLE